MQFGLHVFGCLYVLASDITLMEDLIACTISDLSACNKQTLMCKSGYICDAKARRIQKKIECTLLRHHPLFISGSPTAYVQGKVRNAVGKTVILERNGIVFV